MEQVSLSPGINSPFDEQEPVFSPDGNTLYFTRSNHPENVGGISDQGDIWYSEKLADGTWSKAKNLGRPMNDRFINGVIGFSPDGDKMYLRNFYINDHKNLVKQGISVARKTSSGWRYPENVRIEYFNNDSENQSMCLSADGTIIIMSIQSYGTHGAEDLYVSFKQNNGSWSEPKNLGFQVNTEFQELTPYLAEDNKTLYFSSNGHGGFGSKDIFVTTRLDDSWKNWLKPKNIGYGINTIGAETSFSFAPGTKDPIVISTQNSDGYGDIKKLIPLTDKDIFSSVFDDEKPDVFKDTVVEPERYNLKMLVLDEETKQPVKALIEVVSGADQQKKFEYQCSELGNVTINLNSGYHIIEVTAKNYLVEKFGLELEKDVYRNITLKPAKIGTTIQLENVLFKTSTSELLPSSFAELEKVVKLMKNNPDMVIELSGHTDNRGDYYLNLQLSEDRVQAVKRYLVESGVDKARIKGKGYGGSKPIASNETEATRRLNRRVEFTILKN